MKSLRIFLLLIGVLLPVLAKDFDLKEVQDINLDQNNPIPNIIEGPEDRAWRRNFRNNPQYREFLKEQRVKFRQFYRQLRQQNLTLNQRRQQSKVFRRQMRQQRIQFLQSLKSPNLIQPKPNSAKTNETKNKRALQRRQWGRFLRNQNQQFREFRRNLRTQNLTRRQRWAQIRQFRKNQRQEKRLFLSQLKAQQNNTQDPNLNPSLGLRPTRRPWRPAGHARPLVRPVRPVMAINVAKKNR